MITGANVRVYLMAGTQHGGGGGVHAAVPNRGICQDLNNPLALGQTRLALSVALYEWVAKGVEPPPSRFPTIANDGLIQAAVTGFSDIPGVTYSGSYNPLHLYDHRLVPPTQGDPYTVLIGTVDADGNMTEGIRHPDLAAPIGTHTGWNLRRDGFAEGEQCAGTGSLIPFATHRAERQSSGDPRLSLEERYSNHKAYVRPVSEAADTLVQDRLLLRRDAVEIVDIAGGSGVGGRD